MRSVTAFPGELKYLYPSSLLLLNVNISVVISVSIYSFAYKLTRLLIVKCNGKLLRDDSKFTFVLMFWLITRPLEGPELLKGLTTVFVSLRHTEANLLLLLGWL